MIYLPFSPYVSDVRPEEMPQVPATCAKLRWDLGEMQVGQTTPG